MSGVILLNKWEQRWWLSELQACRLSTDESLLLFSL